MPKGKQWTKAEVKKLQSLLQKGESWKVIAGELNRTVDAVKKKCKRLGLEVVVRPPTPSPPTTTSKLEVSEELLTVEESLEILAAALKAAGEKGLDSLEIQRLNVVATLARAYENLFARFMQYREIEKRLVELEAKYERLAKEKG
jgi:hypothetical protein